MEGLEVIVDSVTRCRRWIFWVMVFFLTASYEASANTGTIEGTIRFEAADGMIGSAEWTRVYLVRGNVPIPRAEIEHGLIEQSEIDRINTAHQKYYIILQQNLKNPKYLVADAITQNDDTFQFEGIAPGRYFIVVAFPSRISGYKVAWHEPIDIPANRSVSIELNKNNIALPTFSRDFGAIVVEAGGDPPDNRDGDAPRW